jgi:hypothetical protein
LGVDSQKMARSTSAAACLVVDPLLVVYYDSLRFLSTTHRTGPVSVDEVELASFIRDGYQAGKGQEAGKQQVREALYRQIKLNAELLGEASKVLKEQPKLAGALLRRLQTDGFDAINMAGLPLQPLLLSQTQYTLGGA